ncbi:camphor resistance protein CrcB [Actinomyces denticolens]|uniref:fluoride efflux transporter FluC n=1 Tax=Actinomyces TaxID=1654 RepID=UPI000980BFCE|nr:MULTISPECIES: CrcB family protein [Actinomyces]SUU13366.1 camphor resistance protein CrcB [Actinomyces denticolens]
MSGAWIWLLMALAGGAGAIARHLVDGRVTAAAARAAAGKTAASSRHGQAGPADGSSGEAHGAVGGPPVPVGTIVVNTTACLLLGILTGWAQAEATAGAASLARVLGTGLLGGYSTFSTASVEGARLAALGRWRAAAAHGLGMMTICLASGAAGMALGAWLPG